MTMLDTLTVRLDADADPLRRELAKIDQSFAALEDKLSFGFPEIDKSLNDLVERWKGVGATAQDVTGATTESQKRLAEATRTLENALTSAFVGAIVDGKRLREVLKGLADEMARLIIRRSIAEPLADAAGSLFGSAFNSLFGGARAEGGPVSAGRAYLVGEQGPELFVPPGSGAIVPNGQMQGPGQSIVINQNISIAPDVSAVARAEIMRQLPMIRNYAAQGITDARLRGALPA